VLSNGGLRQGSVLIPRYSVLAIKRGLRAHSFSI
jgi:hypothetical protein